MKNRKIKIISTVLVFLLGAHVNAQQAAFVSMQEKSNFYEDAKENYLNWNNGYTEAISGDKIFYYSGNPKANHALITRTSNGKMNIEWKTAAIQKVQENGIVTLVWLAGINCNTNEQPYDLELNGKQILTFTTRFSKEWKQTGLDSSTLKFSVLHQDANRDLFGYMFLSAPAEYFEVGEPTSLKITGQAKNTNNWMMVFEYSKVLSDFQKAPKQGFFTISEEDLPWPEYAQDFPSLARGKDNTIWMAVTERLGYESYVSVYKTADGKQQKICMLQVENQTGIAVPAIVAYENTCIVFFPVEKDNKWTIAYCFIDENSSDNQQINTIDSDGTSNISPAVAMSGDEVYVVWESNAGEARGIYSTNVTKMEYGKINRISSPLYNSYNPAIIAIDNGKLFTAWDSYQNNTADIWGAKFSKGKWEKEFRITSDPRIERYPALALNGSELWLCWQAQSYGNNPPQHKHNKSIRLNHVDEQRIVVAQLVGNQLKSPIDLFNKVSTENTLLQRPNLFFTANGKMFLTAREPINPHDGWYGVSWTYQNNNWSEKKIIHEYRGRWCTVNMASTTDSVFAVVQFDNRPKSGGKANYEKDWYSAVSLKSIGNIDTESAVHLETEILQMPPTDFSLTKKAETVSADFPKKSTMHKNKNLKLYFGDFHEHTDISKCACNVNPAGHDLFANLRDIEQLDFCAITDHHNSHDRPIWSFNSEQTRNNQDNGRFVTFLAQEWSSSAGPNSFGYGHHNFIFLDPYMKSYINFTDNYLTPYELWGKMKGIDYISIPHQLADWGGLMNSQGAWGNPPKDWNYYDEQIQPVAEIFQERGSYEYFGCPRQAEEGALFSRFYLQDAWKRKIIIGVIASPDHGGGSGKMGVWAEDLNRESIFNAIRARHTFGTTGAKMKLLFSSGSAIMGDKLLVEIQNPASPQPIHFKVEVEALTDIKELVIFRNNRIIYSATPNQKLINFEWADESPLNVDFVWYYVRIQTSNDEIAWSSPIWFIKE